MTIETDKLPQGWKWAALGEIILGKPQYGSAARKVPYNGKVRYVRITDLTDRGELKPDDPVSPSVVQPDRFLEPGDLLIARSGSVGRTYLHGNLPGTYQYAGYLIRFRIDPAKSLPGYVFYVSKSDLWREWIISNSKTSTLTNINAKQYSSFRLPLPPLCEQKRIAGILNQQMAYVEKARKAAEEILEAAQALPGAFLRQAFPAHGDALPAGWRWVKLKEVGVFKSGGTPSKKRADYWHGEIPFVTGADITELYISKGNARAFLTREGFDSGKTVVCKSGTVLIVTRTRVGRIGIAQEAMGASQDITAFECGDQINQEFLYWYLHKNSDHLIDNSRGSTIQGLTRKFVANIRIPLPPLTEQKRIAALLNEQMAYVETVRMSAREQLDAINALPAALLRRAFAGGL